ncbi:glycoside hydrolase family 95 protein [Porphyromonas macacae]|uniref:glycoside hydrolase family 95 protein n=1 Tax=Porphyromonas macacae TaxID=28115 RepID=UPI0035A04EC4
MKTKRTFLLVFFFSSVVLQTLQAQQTKTDPSTCYYLNTPAAVWTEEFPLGNGRIGLTSNGGIRNWRITLNESSMWSGSTDAAALNPEAANHLPEIRRLLFENKNDSAQQLMYDTFVCGGSGSALGNGANAPYGSYQAGGTLQMDWNIPAQAEARHYRRELNLRTGISKETFRIGTTKITRRLFCSYTKDVHVIHIKAEGGILPDVSLTLNREERAVVSASGNRLRMQGTLNDGYGGQGLAYGITAQIALPKSGQLKTLRDKIKVSGASEIVLFIAHHTDYYKKGVDPLLLCNSTLHRISALSWEHLKQEQKKTFSSYMDRVCLNLAPYQIASEKPIDIRLKNYEENPANDINLPALYLQMGRYLLLSSTRKGALPPNLQGLWTNRIQAPWNGDYHLNINLQMNYWPAEQGNLPETLNPLTDWVEKIVPSGNETARAFYRSRGWVTHILGNVWQFTAPGEHPSWGATNTGGAWLCQHLYNHYRYTQDTAYLHRIYPVMEGAAIFFADMLVEDPRNGYLVTAPTTSPENSFIMPDGKTVSIVAGSTIDNQILRELFDNIYEARQILGKKDDRGKIFLQKRDSLKPTTIGTDGRIMEWMEEYREAEPHHRHVSHLFGLYPGSEISVEHTPELAKAAEKTLLMRGGSSTSWSMAWKVNFWARLGRGDKALELLGLLLKPVTENGKNSGGGTLPNLFSSHPPFQIDGNFGGAGGIMQILLDSESGVISPLPALPTLWSKGYVKGLRTVGNAECDLQWDTASPYTLTSMKLHAFSNYTHTVKLPPNSSKSCIVRCSSNEPYSIENGLLTVRCKAGSVIEIVFR